MKLYNTLTRKIQDFHPAKKSEVTLYTCGPTVYDFAQIGNLRAFVFDDTLRRTLEACGYQVKHVMNITDVGHLTSDMDEGEDKLEKGAAREKKSVWDVADFYIGAYTADAQALNILPPNGYTGRHSPYARATDFIPQQIDLVERLIDKGFAYVAKSAVYFDVAMLPDYGKLTGQKLADKEVAVRPEVVYDAEKRHPQDFGLWFFTVGRFASHSMAWDSPWGKGFPGWHLECSAIIHATLGEPVDIHTGGVDHIGTHHTNEIAQTEAAFGIELARYWLHNEHLLVDGQKMSKSKGNFYTLKDVKERGFEPLALRLLFLQSHYRSQMNFSWDSLAAAQHFLKDLQAWADLKFQPAAAKLAEGHLYQDELQKMRESLANDLNSAAALGVLSELAAAGDGQGIQADKFPNLLKEVDQLFGLSLSNRQDVGDDIKSLLAKRQQARQDQNWPLSDELRAETLKKQVEVKDTPAGQIWRRL